MSYPPPPDPTRPLPPEEPASGQPWSAQSGDPLAAQPYEPPATPQFQPGYAPLPPADSQASAPPDGYPPTSQFPAVQNAYPPPPPGYGTASGYGTPPGYGPPPGYGAPPPGYGTPPPPPPKRSNTPLVAVLIAVTLLLCAGGVTSAVLLVNRATDKAKETIESLPTAVPTEDVPELPDLPTDLPTLPTLPTDLPTDLPELPTGLPNAPGKGAAIKVEYEITGDGPVEIVYMEELGKDPKRVRNASLPWRKKVTLHGSALVSVVAVRGATSEGTISCRATVDGQEVAQKTRTGTFVTATCSKVIF